MRGDANAWEYRVCVADESAPDVPEDVSGELATEEEARKVLAEWLSQGFADPPYEIGWIERRPCVAWLRVP